MKNRCLFILFFKGVLVLIILVFMRLCLVFYIIGCLLSLVMWLNSIWLVFMLVMIGVLGCLVSVGCVRMDRSWLF